MSRTRPTQSEPRVSLARALSKLGACSRSQAVTAVEAGRVTVNGTVVRDPSHRVDPARDRMTLDDEPVRPAGNTYVMLNKPRGLVTTRVDERGRDTVYMCFHNAPYPRIVPVGRLDRDSEGLLLFTNDTRWADRIIAPSSHISKMYHVHLETPVTEGLIRKLRAGVDSRGEVLRAVSVEALSEASLEIVLDEGRNRHIRRMLEPQGAVISRLVRTAIGPLQLGRLAPGAHRPLSERERESLDAAVPARS